MPGEHVLHRLGTRAKRGAAGDQPHQRNHQAPCCGKANRKPRPHAVEPFGRTGQGRRHHLGKQTTQRAAGEHHHQAGHERVPVEFGHHDDAVIAVVAKERHAHQAGQHDAGDDQATAARFEFARELLDGEQHARQWGIEGGGNAGRAACHQQRVVADARMRAEPSPRVLHHAGSNLYRRAFASHRHAGQEARGAQHHFGGGQAQGDEIRALGSADGGVERGDHLWNARACGGGSKAACGPDNGGGPGRNPHQHRPAALPVVHTLEPGEGVVGQEGEAHHAEPCDGGIGQHHRAVQPHASIGQLVAQVLQNVGLVVVHG